MAALKAERPSSRVKDRTNPMESYWRDIQHYEPLSRAREIDLDEREHKIIRSCFGLEDQVPMTLEKIGGFYHCHPGTDARAGAPAAGPRPAKDADPVGRPAAGAFE